MKANRFDNILYFNIFLLSFLGYYAILLLLFNLGLSETSRSVTIPIRLGIVAMLVVLFLKNIKHLQSVKGIHWFLFFCFVYLYRLFDDYNSLELYYMSIPDVLLFFLSFAVIPFIVLSTQPLSKSKLKMNGIYTTGDPDNIVKKMVLIMQNQEKLQALGDFSRKLIIDHYSNEIVLEKHLKAFYSELKSYD